jgi:hypothetical protein
MVDDETEPFGTAGPQGRLGHDPGRLLACGQCGWQGPDASECPWCHEPVTGEMPTAEEIIAARRNPTGA